MAKKTGWYELLVSSAQQPEFAVAALEGEEAIGAHFRFDLDVACASADLDLGELIGKPATIGIKPWHAEIVAAYHGVVTQAQLLGDLGESRWHYRLRVEPVQLWRARHAAGTATYCDGAERLGLEQLLTRVFERLGLQSGIDFKLDLAKPIRRRSFVMQYAESDHDFMQRWIEREGAFHVYEHGEHRSLIKLVDDNGKLPQTTHKLRYSPRGAPGADDYQRALLAFSATQRGGAERVRLADYNYRHSHRSIGKPADSGVAGGCGERFEFGSDLRSDDEAAAYARLQAQAVACAAQQLSGRTLACGLYAGERVEVQGHPRSAFNAKYLVTAVRHRGTQAGYGLPRLPGATEDDHYVAEFDALPAELPFRLPRRTPWPRIAGHLPALIDGEEDDAALAQVDGYGRYKLRFPFVGEGAKPGKASARVRLASPYGGPGEQGSAGFHFPLHKGAEVALSFIDGDPDRPIIIGVLPNSRLRSTVVDSNAGVNRIVSAAGHQLELDDTAGTRRIRLRTGSGRSMMFLGAFGVPPRAVDPDDSNGAA